MATTYASAPTPADLEVWLGWGPFDDELAFQAQAHLDRARRVVKAYTRGRGFLGEQVAEDIAEVIKSVAGRSMANPTDAVRIEAGKFNSMPALGQLSLADRLTLDEYRRKAA